MPTRGERDDDPGNINRSHIAWEGQAADQSGDSRFVIFTDPIYGIRVIGKLLLAYQAVHNCDTITKLISRWAPPNENNTTAYIAEVAGEVGVGADDPIDLDDAALLEKTITAIIRHENGEVIYSADQIAKGTAMALQVVPRSA